MLLTLPFFLDITVKLMTTKKKKKADELSITLNVLQIKVTT